MTYTRREVTKLRRLKPFVVAEGDDHADQEGDGGDERADREGDESADQGGDRSEWEILKDQFGSRALSVQMETEAMEYMATTTRAPERECKYHMLAEPPFVKEMQKAAAAEDPPNFSTQGEDVGKTRGRKPAKNKAKEALENEAEEPKEPKARKPRATSKAKADGDDTLATSPTRVRGRVPASKRKQPVKSNAETGESAVSTDKKKDSKSSKRAKGKHEANGVENDKHDRDSKVSTPPIQPEHGGELRKPPAHITANHVYSSAYVKYKAHGDDIARQAGQMAATMFRESGQVDDLCGLFRAPRRKPAAVKTAEGQEVPKKSVPSEEGKGPAKKRARKPANAKAD